MVIFRVVGALPPARQEGCTHEFVGDAGLPNRQAWRRNRSGSGQPDHLMGRWFADLAVVVRG